MCNQYFLCADISDTLQDAIALAFGKLGGFLQDTAGNIFGSWLYDASYELLSLACDIYDRFVNRAYDILIKSPKEWCGSGWSLVENLNNQLMVLASTLACVFFLIGFCKESIEPRGEFRLENILKMFIKISLADFFITQSLTIVCWMFDFVNYFSKGNLGSFSLNAAGNVLAVLKNAQAVNGDTYPFGEMLVLLIVAVLFFVVSLGVSVLIVYQAFTRMFKIVSIIPLGTLASSTLAGDHQLSQSAASFYKFVLNCVLEAGIMIFSMALFSKIQDSIPALIIPGLSAETAADYMDCSIYLIVQGLMMLTLYGVIKQSSESVRRALAL